MRALYVPLYTFPYFPRVLNQSKYKRGFQEATNRENLRGMHTVSPSIARFSCRRQDSRHLTNVVEGGIRRIPEADRTSFFFCIEVARRVMTLQKFFRSLREQREKVSCRGGS